MNSVVVRGGCVVTLDRVIGTLPKGDVLIADGRIEAVGERLEVGDEVEVIDATDRIVLPGLVDTHRHTWQTTLRGMLPDCTLGEYFGAVMIGAGPVATVDDVYAGTLLGAYELLNAGVTSVVDWANVTNTPEHADAGLAALNEAGIRAMYGYGWPGGMDYLFNSALPHPEDARRFAAEHFSSKDQLLTFGLALRGPSSCAGDIVRHDWELARDLDARITVHVGMRIPGVDIHEVEVLDGLGLLGADTTYVHCNGCTDGEISRIAETGGTVSISAYCESVMGHGRPPTRRLWERGLRPSLSADVVVTVPGDMFSQMRSTYAEARTSGLPHDPSEAFAPTITANDVLSFATIDGAKAMGLESIIGSLTPGKDADLILIRTDQINTMPVVDPVATVVISADTSNVDTVFVRGQAVKRDGALLNVDMGRLRRLGDASRDRLLAHLAARRTDAA